ncbi:hypothetical protein B7486_73170 [cyanobacterium TDX16]|nr:hypothetical protein B7486_73170 [cyanobacterium TDX16]
MTVIDGPGGPTTEHDDRQQLAAETFERLATQSPDAAWDVLVGLSARLRQHDLDIASRWSAGVEDELLD